MCSVIEKCTPVALSLLIVQLLLAGSVSASGCGVRRNHHRSLIVRGSLAREGDWPWHSALFHRESDKPDAEHYACGGTLINELFVLTAAHCLLDQQTGDPLTPDRLVVRFGVHHLNELYSSRVQSRSVKSIYVHDDYNQDTAKNDIALLELRDRVQFTNFVVAACLNNQADLTNHTGTAVGWGYTEFNKLSTALREANLPVVDMYTCLEEEMETFVGRLHRGLLCVGYRNGTQVCNGDSGGGLFFRRDGLWYLGAITSFCSMRDDGTNLCSTRGYAAFTDVAKYLPWIEEKTGIVLGSLKQKVNEEKCVRAGRVTRPSNKTIAFATIARNAPNSKDDEAPLMDLGPTFDDEQLDLSCIRNHYTLHREADDKLTWLHSDGWFLSIDDRRTCNGNVKTGKDLTVMLPGNSFLATAGKIICIPILLNLLTPQFNYIEKGVWFSNNKEISLR